MKRNIIILKSGERISILFNRRWFGNYFREIPLNRKILYFFVPVITIPLILLAVFSGKIAADIALQKAVANTNDKLNLVSSQIDLVIRNIELSMKMIGIDSNLQNALSRSMSESMLDHVKISTKLHEVFLDISNTYSYIDNAFLYLTDGRVFDAKMNLLIYDEKAQFSDRYKQAFDERGRVVWNDLHSQIDPRQNNSAWNISKAVIDLTTGKTLGIISIDINESAFSKVLSSITAGDRSDYSFVNPEGIVVSTLTKPMLNKSVQSQPYFQWVVHHRGVGKVFTFNNQKVLVTGVYMRNPDWYLISTIPIFQLTKENGRIMQLIIAIGLLLLVLTLVISFTISRTIVAPIWKLVRFTRRVSEGDLDTELDMMRNDEIGELARHFNIMVRNIKGLMVKNYLEQKKKRELELSLLQSQVNPHFLYNTIDNLRSLTLKGDLTGAYELATNLGNFYKGVLSQGREIITIAEELALTSTYMDIQKIRYDHSFLYKIHLEDTLKHSAILKLTLQPLVENAIKHGLKGLSRKGIIRIWGNVEDGQIVLKVEDNGRGIRPERLAEIIDGENGPSGGFALKNLDARIMLQFGEGYGINVHSEVGSGTFVTVTLPMS